ncbi:MAG TPA: glycosyltransferase family 4 protein [Syntrophomonadaceae bacterium]|nr:glycosyltransferase family 4 protein [Syntrophomonadaceae bacterium]
MKIANVGTYPPKQCGIATFSMDLRNSLLVNNVEVDIIALSDESYQYEYPAEVKFVISQTKANDYFEAVNYINEDEDIDAVIIQHEYGIFGGSNGRYVLEFAKNLKKPYLVVTHTVLPTPLEEQKSVLNQLCKNAAGVVCMTKLSATLLSNLYKVSRSKIQVINHGVPYFEPKPNVELKEEFNLTDKQVISTFGLIGPGKGLELGIRAMVDVVKYDPSIVFLILGQTHPMLKKTEGEKYREMLEKLTVELGLVENVKFVNKFLSDEELGEYLYLTDIYLSPYPNMDQAVSGTLTFAIGCGRAIVSTAYAYATEVLKDNTGLLAKEPTPLALAQLMIKVLEDDNLKKDLQKNAMKLGRNWSWPNIGKKYAYFLGDVSNKKITREANDLKHVGL